MNSIKQACRKILQDLVAGKLQELPIIYDEKVGFAGLGEDSQDAEIQIDGRLYRVNVQFIRDVPSAK